MPSFPPQRKLTLLVALLSTSLAIFGTAAAQTTGPGFVPDPNAPLAPPEQELNAHATPYVAIFRDTASWGYYLAEDILAANGIPYASFNSAAIGSVDISGYTKVLIPANQPTSLYAAVMANHAYFQSYVQAGGVLQIHAAAWEPGFGSDWVSYPATIYPGITYTHYYGSQQNFAAPSHIILNSPNVLDTTMTGCCSPHHGSLTAPGALVIQTGDGGDAVMVEKMDGSGIVLASTITSDYSWGSHVDQAQENYVLYLVGGAATPPVPELSSVLLALAGAGLVGIVLVARRK